MWEFGRRVYTSVGASCVHECRCVVCVCVSLHVYECVCTCVRCVYVCGVSVSVRESGIARDPDVGGPSVGPGSPGSGHAPEARLVCTTTRTCTFRSPTG